MIFDNSQAGSPPREAGPCVCPCHLQLPKPRRLAGRWMCEPCYEAQADGYGMFLREMARA